MCRYAHLEGAILDEAHLAGASLREAFLDAGTALVNIALADGKHGEVAMVDVRWDGVNLAPVPWGQLKMLGNERRARTAKDARGRRKERPLRLAEYELAVRANRQLALALRGQGLSEDADRFAYRALVLQREVLRRQHLYGKWAFSLLLGSLSGYGYRLRRILFAYLAVLLGFTDLYFMLGLPHPQPVSQPESLRDAFLVSLTAIHGRVFLEQLGQYSVQAWVAAIESVVGIVIEGVFVAMLVQRFFAR